MKDSIPPVPDPDTAGPEGRRADHETEAFWRGQPRTYGWQCLACEAGEDGLADEHAAILGAARHGVVVDPPSPPEASPDTGRGLVCRCEEAADYHHEHPDVSRCCLCAAEWTCPGYYDEITAEAESRFPL